MSSKALVEHALSQLATHHHGPKPRRTNEDDMRPRCAPRALEDVLLAKTDWWVGARARRQCSSIAHRLSVLPRVQYMRAAHTRVCVNLHARARGRDLEVRVCACALCTPSRMSAAASKKPAVLHPATLSSGPESGLCNQIFALIGYTVMAKRLNAGLVLPNWTSHDHGGHDMAFETLFEPETFARSLRRIGIRTWRSPPPRQNLSTYTRPPALSGWRLFKLESHKFVNISIFEEAVILGLRPVASIRSRVQAFQASNLGGTKYGCLHARIETDMVKSWRMNRAGPPPKLGPLLQSMGEQPLIRRMDRILVAVGVAISHADDATLNNRTAWNASMVRVQTGKTHHRTTSKNTSGPAYIDAALVDFELCREAEWFVGWPGSTFARVLAFYHTHERGDWFLTCGPTNGSTGYRMWHETRPDKWRDHLACLRKPGDDGLPRLSSHYSGASTEGTLNFTGLEGELIEYEAQAADRESSLLKEQQSA